MDTFLERHKLSKLTEEIENLNSLVSVKETNFVIKNLPRKKTPDPVSFTCESYQIFLLKKKELTTFHKLFPKQKRKKNIPTQSRKFSTKLMPKSEKDISKKVQCNISYKYRCKNHQQHTSKLKPEIHKKALHI